jgi:type IV secretory pathway VirB6-like protein
MVKIKMFRLSRGFFAEWLTTAVQHGQNPKVRLCVALFMYNCYPCQFYQANFRYAHVRSATMAELHHEDHLYLTSEYQDTGLYG